MQKESQRKKAEEDISPLPSEVIQPSVPYDAIIPLHHAASTGLIGRDDLLANVRQHLKDEGNAAVYVLSGLPGVGKTALAASLARDAQIQEEFRDGILWAGLGTQPDSMILLHRWSVLLGLDPVKVAALTSIESRATALREAIGSRRMLLILDDVWATEDVSNLTVGGENCVHIVTTRLPALALAVTSHELIEVQPLHEQASEQLLTILAPNLLDEPKSVQQGLISLVGGLPLALHLMGRYLRVHAAGGQRRRLQMAINQLQNAEVRLQLHEYPIPAERPPHLPSGSSRSLLSTIVVSIQQLEERARTAFFALSVFPAKPNTFSEAAALAVCAVPIEVLDTVNDAGMLEHYMPDRYTLHQTISDYIQRAPQEKQIYERMVSYFVLFIEEYANKHATLEQETTNILAALRIAYEWEMYEEFLRGVLAFAPFLLIQGMYTIADTLLQQANAIAQLLSTAIKQHISILLYQGKVAEKQGEYIRAVSLLQEGLMIARRSGIYDELSNLLDTLGSIQVQQGDQTSAENSFNEGLATARLRGDQRSTSDLLAKIGTLAAARGDLTSAETYFQEGLKIARAIGYRERVSLLLNNLGWVADELQKYAQAESYFREALLLARELGHRHGIGRLLGNLAWIAAMGDRYLEAEEYFQEALAIARSLDQHWLISNILRVKGEMYLRCDDLQQAEEYFQEALKYVPAEAHELRIMIQFNLAKVHAASGDYVTARSRGEACLTELTVMNHSKATEVRGWLQTLEYDAPTSI